MGNSQTLTPPSTNSKFQKYQTSKESIYIHIQITSKTAQLTPWLAQQQFRNHIYCHPCQYSTHHEKNIQDGLCSQSCTAIFRSSKAVDNLYDEIGKRNSIGRFYAHQEIWYMLYSLTTYAIAVHEKGWKWIIGNVHPKNIFIDELGEVNVISLNSLPFEKDHYETYKQEGLDSAFISPELIGFTFSKDKIFGVFPDCVNRHSSEAFTIGMTMLCMCTLENDLSSIYDFSFYTKDHKDRQKSARDIRKTKVHDFGELMDLKLLSFQLNQIKNKYGSLLATVIKGLLQANPEQRLSLNYLFKQILSPNETYISQLDGCWLSGENITSLASDFSEPRISFINSHLY